MLSTNSNFTTKEIFQQRTFFFARENSSLKKMHESLDIVLNLTVLKKYNYWLHSISNYRLQSRLSVRALGKRCLSAEGWSGGNNSELQGLNHTIVKYLQKMNYREGNVDPYKTWIKVYGRQMSKESGHKRRLRYIRMHVIFTWEDSIFTCQFSLN